MQIALGTVILLSGVLALSWRLNADPSSRPAVAQTPLTPGLGIMDEETPETASTITTPIDEEAPLLDKESLYARETPRTPTPNSHSILNIAKTRRPPSKTEEQEIWDELEHDDTLNPISPFPNANRRMSLRSASNLSSKRTSRFDLPDVADEEDANASPGLGSGPNESTALLARSGTGRTYRDYRRRRSLPGFEGRERRRRSVSLSQQALGGWWKMEWWKQRRKGKGKETEDPEDGRGLGDGRETNGNRRQAEE